MSFLAKDIWAESEDAVKAALLFNFAKFTEWPDSAFSGDKLVVGFVGSNSLASTFEKAVVGKFVGAREVVVKKISASEAAGCQMVFVGDAGKAGAVQESVKGKPVLTVGNGDSFVAGGGMVALSMDGRRVVFSLNLGAIKTANLSVNSKLKRFAKSTRE
jgi:hypothetical protein